MTTKDLFRGTSVAYQSTGQALEELGLTWKPAASSSKHGECFQYLRWQDKAMYRPEDGLFMGYVSDEWFEGCGTFESAINTFKDFADLNNLPIERVGKLQSITAHSSGDHTLNIDLYAVATLQEERAKSDLGVGDTVSSSILLTFPFNSGRGIKASALTVSLVCTNGMTTNNTVRQVVRHNSGSAKVVSALQQAHDSALGLIEEAEYLAQVTMPHDVAIAKLIEQFGDPTRPADKQPKVLQQMLDRWDRQDFIGADMLSRYNTAWGLLNLVTEYYNHNYGRRKTADAVVSNILDVNSPANKAQNDFLRSISSFAHAERQRNGAAYVPQSVVFS